MSFSDTVRRVRTGVFLLSLLLLLCGCEKEADDGLVLRVANVEEYIDLGGWEEGEEIELSDGTVIFSENSLVEDFEAWYEETYKTPVRVEYSTYGTNEDLYNMMRLGDVFDVVCPSEYMLLKLLEEDRLQPLSEDFFDESVEENYYVKNLSPYIRNVFQELSMDGKTVADYGVGYMWGTLGIVYNPEFIPEEEAAHYKVLLDPKYYKQVTMKDSIRDSYFAGLAILREDVISSTAFRKSSDYHEELSEIMNSTDEKTVDAVEKVLSDMRENVYSLETDSGKADLVTGKVLANLQWSGDAVYTLDEAEKDGVYLSYAAPEECANLWFDGWVMMKNGIAQDERKQHAAEAFLNFISRPDSAIRNMYYIGYTSVISGTEDGQIFDYINWSYAAEDDEDSVPYDISYFFDGIGATGTYVVDAPPEQLHRQLYTQYPTAEVLDRSVVMRCFDKEANERISRMWTDIRCFHF